MQLLTYDKTSGRLQFFIPMWRILEHGSGLGPSDDASLMRPPTYLPHHFATYPEHCWAGIPCAAPVFSLPARMVKVNLPRDLTPFCTVENFTNTSVGAGAPRDAAGHGVALPLP